MRERALTFGPEGALVGVWTEPNTRRPTPAVVLLNSGVVHHVGVFRLHVRLARALADVGVPSLRFDLSGVGDSPNRVTSATLEELVQLDIDAALEVVGSQGVENAVLMGLCSGARDAVGAAGAGGRVSGIICIDLIADLRTWQYHAVHYGRRFTRLENWSRTLSGKTKVVQRVLSHFREREEQPGLEDMLGLRPVTERAWLAKELGRFMDAGGRALMVFTAGLGGNYNHAAQFRGALPSVARNPNISVSYFDDADHIFSRPEHQAELISQVIEWMRTWD